MSGSNERKVEDLLTIGNTAEFTSRVFNNKFIYCYQKAEDFDEGGKFTVKEKYLISKDNVIKKTSKGTSTYTDEKIVKYAQGLAHILSNYDENAEAKRNISGIYQSKFDSVQIALWEYLYLGNSDNDVKRAFSISESENIDGGYKTEGLGYTYLWVGSEKYEKGWHSKKANEIYDTAYEIYLMNKKSSLNAEIYILTNEDCQELLMLKKSTEGPTIPPVTLTFQKQDFSGNSLSDATINITGVENVSLDTTLPSQNGVFGTIKVTPNKNTGTFKIKIHESTPPAGYKEIEDTELTVSYDTGNGTVTTVESNNDTYVPKVNNSSTVTIKNKPVLNLNINKTDSLTGNKLSGVRFRVELTNVASINDYQVQTTGETQDPPRIVYVTTNDDGQIRLEGIEPNEVGTNITATITEVEVPNTDGKGYYYIKIDPITITISYNTKNKTYYVSGYNNARVSENTVTLGIENIPYITLDGTVWQDAQTGNKLVTGPNGKRDEYYKYNKAEEGKGEYKYNEEKRTFEKVGQGKGDYTREKISEKGIDGVLVQLYDIKNKNIKASTTTKDGGKYSFTDVEMTNEGYKIVFNYDGINYIETKAYGKDIQNYGTDSKATETEKERTDFNNRFKTISAGASNDGTPLSYKYKDKVSSLKVGMDGTNPESKDINKQFRMSATTNRIYKDTTPNINCGLVKKELDLAIGTDVKSARLEINDKSTTYSREQIMNGEIADLTLDEILEGKSSEKSNPTYNLKLYKSDYNYRIEDYKKDNEAIKNEVNPEDNGVNNYENLKELEAYVTYSVFLKNQTTYNATVDKFVYYFDKIYIPQFKVGDTINDYKVVSIEDNKITFESANDKNELKAPDYRKEIDLTFKVNKNDKGIELKENCTNIAEITKYSTNAGGLIDNDSAPGNAGVTFTNGTPKIRQYEDDTDQAKGLNISVKEDKIRKITGTVFEDTKGENDKYNGKKDDVEKPVNDVIVQLIEIKKLEDGNYYEYIWQETRSGSGNVKKMHGDEKTIEDKQYRKAPNDGTYEFTGYIPGNYIIRYIYGDGTTYDITDNVKTYNGQDYKSTVDNKYKEPWYNTAGYTAGYSVARDNEARRLEVMAYSTTIDDRIGTALKIYNKNIAYNDLTDIQKEDIREHYNSITIEEYNKAVEQKNSSKMAEEKLIIDRMEEIFTADLLSKEIKDITEDFYKKFEKYISYKTWMCAETSRINVPVDADNKNTDSSNTTVPYKYEGTIQFNNMNFGLAERPKTNLILEKHITGLKITPNGTGVQSIVDAKADIKDILDNGSVNPKGVTQGLATIMSTRKERGFWQVATDVEELAQGAQLEVEYTYVIRNDGEKDYLSKKLIDAYEDQDTKPYEDTLKEINGTVKGAMRNGSYSYSNNNNIGAYLGQTYYLGPNEDESVPDTDVEVPSRIETLEEALNNDLTFETGDYFEKNNQETVKKMTIDKDGNERKDAEGNPTTEITTVVQSTSASSFLKPNDVDYSKTITLKTLLSSSTGGELGATIPSYIAEVVKYSNAAGRRDMNAEPANLSYVHSDDTRMTMESDNERDEFWGESIIITKPTGEDKLTPIQIAIITVSSMAVLGVGIVLIKKFVLKK